MAGKFLSGKHPTQSKQITQFEKWFSKTELKNKFLHSLVWETQWNLLVTKNRGVLGHIVFIVFKLKK